jgi:hypothetical protein
VLADTIACLAPLRRLLCAGATFAVLSVLGCSDAPPDDTRLRPSKASIGSAVKGRVSGTGASGLRVREAPTTASKQLATLPDGQVITISCQVEGETIEGNKLWDRVDAEGGYVADAFVTIDAGEASLPRCDAPAAPAPDPVPNGNATVDIEGPPVQPHVQVFANDACAQVKACRATTREGHEPSADLAIDMPTGAGYGQLPTDNHVFGDRLAEFAVTNQTKYRIEYVIYRQRINFGDGWEPMEDRGDITQNHFDHVHVSFDP